MNRSGLGTCGTNGVSDMSIAAGHCRVTVASKNSERSFFLTSSWTNLLLATAHFEGGSQLTNVVQPPM